MERLTCSYQGTLSTPGYEPCTSTMSKCGSAMLQQTYAAALWHIFFTVSFRNDVTASFGNDATASIGNDATASFGNNSRPAIASFGNESSATKDKASGSVIAERSMDTSSSETACARASSPITVAEGAGDYVIAARSKDSASGSEIV